MKFILISTLFLFSIIKLSAQNDPGSKGNFFIGGNLGISTGSYTHLNLSPQIGYRFNRFLAAGAGINAQYIGLKENFNGSLYRRMQQGVAGVNLFGRFFPIEQLMVQVQPELNYIFGRQTFYQPSREVFKLDDVIVPSILIGGGVVLPSRHGSFIAALYYDVWQDGNSVYGQKPFLNFGYTFNLK